MRYIIDFTQEATETEISAYLDALSVTSVVELDKLGKTFVVECEVAPAEADIVETLYDDDAAPIQLLSELRSEIEYKNFDIASEDNWWKLAVIPGLDLDADEAQIMRAGHGVRVYLVDSGIDETHSDFADKDITLLHSKTGEFSDTTGHGTALASLIVGETCGLSEASLRVVKVFHDGQPTLVSEVLAALQAVAEDFMLYDAEPAILNLSWSIAKNAYVESKIMALMDKGILAIVAAGNDGTPIANVTPASMATAVTVGSFGPELKPSDFTNYTGAADTSYTAGATNYGVGLDLFAPGEGIRVALPGGGFGYTLGTSAATAIMSAVTALNFAARNGGYDVLDYTSVIQYTKGNFVTSELLELDGDYETSPNLIPRVRLKKFDPNTDLLPIIRPHMLFPSEKAVKIALFNANYATASDLVSSEIDGATLSGNWFEATMPAVETYDIKHFVYSVTVEDLTEEIDVSVFIFNPEVYPDGHDATADAGYRELDCNCPPGFLCCGNCDPKLTQCDSCHSEQCQVE